MSSCVETKRIINKYYKEKIRELCNKEDKAKTKYIETIINNFNDFKEQTGLNKLIDDINVIYEQDFSIELNKYRIKGFENTKEYKDIRKEISNLEKELDRILFTYESFPKNSEKYKQVMIKIYEIIEEMK